MKKILASLLATSMLFAAGNVAKAQDEMPPLKDLNSNHWAYESVKEVVGDYEIMKGDPSGRFSGNRRMSRYEFAATLSNLMNFYNEEFAADREDLASLVHIMEQFQEELKLLETRTAALNSKIEQLDTVLAEYKEKTDNRISNVEEGVDGLSRAGLIKNFLRGSTNDVKSVVRTVTPAPASEKEANADVSIVEVETQEDVGAVLIEGADGEEDFEIIEEVETETIKFE